MHTSVCARTHTLTLTHKGVEVLSMRTYVLYVLSCCLPTPHHTRTHTHTHTGGSCKPHMRIHAQQHHHQLPRCYRATGGRAQGSQLEPDQGPRSRCMDGGLTLCTLKDKHRVEAASDHWHGWCLTLCTLKDEHRVEAASDHWHCVVHTCVCFKCWAKGSEGWAAQY
jgi:hypothetical protein